MSDTYVPTPWEDPTLDPWIQGLPTQQDIFANEYGQGFNGDQDDVDDNLDVLKEYLKMQQKYIPDLIPGLPEWVDAPDTSEPVYRSDFVETYRNDPSYNQVYTLVNEHGFGFDEAVSAVLGMAEEQGWAMPMELDQGDRLMNFDSYGNPIVQKTVDQYNAEQEWIAAGGPVDDNGVPRKRGDNSDPDDPLAGFDYQAPPNYNEALFAANALKFFEEKNEENRSQSDRDAAIAKYEDFHAPRFSFDVRGALEQGGKFAGRTNYSPAPPPQGLGPVAPGGFDPNYSLPQGRRGPVAQGGFDPNYSTRGGLVGPPAPGGPVPPSIPSSLGGMNRPHAALNDLPGSQNRYGLARQGRLPAPARSQSSEDRGRYERDKKAADRTNAANAAASEEFNEAYNRRIRELAAERALPSKAQQNTSMIDNFLASIAYGGGQ